jgi:hypothetical protein
MLLLINDFPEEVSKRDIPERGLTQTTQISYPRTTAIIRVPLFLSELSLKPSI